MRVLDAPRCRDSQWQNAHTAAKTQAAILSEAENHADKMLVVPPSWSLICLT